MLISLRSVIKHGRHRQFFFLIGWFLKNLLEMNNAYRGPSIDTSYQVSVHLVKWFQRRRFFRNQPIRKKNCLWRPCLITDRPDINWCNSIIKQTMPIFHKIIFKHIFHKRESLFMLPKGKFVCMLKGKFCVASLRFLAIIILYKHVGYILSYLIFFSHIRIVSVR
jgi:hypothetical protein